MAHPLVAGLLLAPFLALGAPTQQPAWVPAVQAAIEAQLQRDRIPGLSCAIGLRGEILYRAGFGLADIENDVPATPQTVYRLASISKPITAVLALQMAERGELDLDAPVHTLVPQWPEKAWPISTRQLLAHLGGVRHYQGETESTEHYARQTDSLPRFAADPLLHEPGTKYHYSTYGYNLVAAVVEARTGKSFAAVLRERIAEPAKAPTLQDDDSRRLIRGRAQGYVRQAEVTQNSQLMDSSYKLGGGGLCASAEDLVRFSQALLDGRLLNDASRTAMWTRQRTTGGDEVDYGLGCRPSRRDGRLVIEHSGAQARVSTMWYMLPESQVVVVLLCNLERVRLQPLAQQIAAMVAPAATDR